MKTILYFILSIVSIIYFVAMAYLNLNPEISGTFGQILYYVAKYGALVIILAFAGVNFFGNPFKIAFFVLLVLAVVLYIVTAVIPGPISKILGI